MPMNITTSRKELTDLVKAWVAISVAFSIVMHGLRFDPSFLVAFAVSAIVVGAGFLFHELAHKFIAQRFRCWAEFRSDDKMLLLAIVFSFMGFIFAAPGAVLIRGHIDRRQSGLISAAGPFSNMVVAIAFLAMFFTSNPLYQLIGSYGFRINAWLAVFNLIPVGVFDGAKIWEWNKVIYFALVALGIFLMVLQFNI
ncbi:TPA: peptidase M50 [Candidatus Woesearchaeota archaeon]|nr:peptidase M50 [Candidatus Woesearchaeota archaeon]